MTKRVGALALVALLQLVFLATAEAQQGNSIRGKVRNSDGAAMPRVTVELQTGNGAAINQTVTNNEGDFAFTGLIETSYALVISAPDYKPLNERVDFFNRAGERPGETRTVEISLVSSNGDRRTARPGTTFVQNVPKEARAAFEKALTLLRDNNTAEAMAALGDAIRSFPGYFDAHFVLGKEFMKAGKHSEAIAQLDEARRINPRDDRTYELFGLVLMQQKKYAVAAAVFAEASRLNALEPQYPLMRGIALIEHASSISPGTSKSAAAERNSTLDEAEKNLAHAYELSNRKLTTVHLQLARVYEKQGNRLRAAGEMEQYLKENPASPNAEAIRDGIKKLRSKQ
jgi:Tfp pilus assembly protein PilF